MKPYSQTQETPPWSRKTFNAALSGFFKEHCPQIGGDLMVKALVDALSKVLEELCPKTERLRPGQLVWLAVDQGETSGYGKRIEDCKLRPVVLDLVSSGDIDAFIEGLPKRERMKLASKRLFEQAFEQGGVLTSEDVAAMLKISSCTVGHYVREMERDLGLPIPRRGNVHDLGPTLTHKRIICVKCLKEGKTIEETARETSHSTEAVTRYVNDFKRIKTCLDAGWPLEKISYATKLSKSLTLQYINLIEEDGLGK
jgi:hypothetical protein